MPLVFSCSIASHTNPKIHAVIGGTFQSFDFRRSFRLFSFMTMVCNCGSLYVSHSPPLFSLRLYLIATQFRQLTTTALSNRWNFSAVEHLCLGCQYLQDSGWLGNIARSTLSVGFSQLEWTQIISICRLYS